MNKPLLLLYGPVDTYSGYGGRARDVAKALIKMDKYDIKIISCNWGSTPHGFLKPDIFEHKQIIDCILAQPTLPKQPDIYVMVSVPNEMQKLGKYNILITAGIEASICRPEWVEGLNRADLILASSNHTKKVFLDSKFEKRDQQTQQLVEIVECKTPIEILFEGLDTTFFKKLDKVEFDLNYIKEEFVFLYTGHWLQGDIGEDRKNTSGLVKTFLETFKNKKIKPALLLKTSGANYSIMDKEEILSKINFIRSQIKGDLPNIYVLHGELTDSEMNEINNHPKVKAFVTFTKGEGFGRPLLECSVTQKPIIASNWGGQTDFLNIDFNLMLPGNLTQIHKSALNDMFVEGSQWFTVDYRAAANTLENVYTRYNTYLDGAKRQAYKSRTEFTLEKMTEKFKEIMDKAPIVEVKQIVLPSFNKNFNLPKLKKV